jgi:predicted Zn-dependent protease with MMP-like domain
MHGNKMEEKPEKESPDKPPRTPEERNEEIRAAFDRYVEAAIQRLPPDLKKALDEIELIVDDVPERKLLRRRGSRPFSPGILGLYSGTSMAHRSVFNPMEWPGKIYLFRRNILRYSRSREELEKQIFLTLMHELGHALGLDEGQLKARGMG